MDNIRLLSLHLFFFAKFVCNAVCILNYGVSVVAEKFKWRSFLPETMRTEWQPIKNEYYGIHSIIPPPRSGDDFDRLWLKASGSTVVGFMVDGVRIGWHRERDRRVSV